MGFYRDTWNDYLLMNKLQDEEICGARLSNPDGFYTAPFASRKMTVARFGEMGLSLQVDRDVLDPVLIFEVPERGIYGLWDEQWSFIYRPVVTSVSVQASIDHLKWLLAHMHNVSSSLKACFENFEVHALGHPNNSDTSSKSFDFYKKFWHILLDDWALLPMQADVLASVPLANLGFSPTPLKVATVYGDLSKESNSLTYWRRDTDFPLETRALQLREVE